MASPWQANLEAVGGGGGGVGLNKKKKLLKDKTQEQFSNFFLNFHHCSFFFNLT